MAFSSLTKAKGVGSLTSELNSKNKTTRGTREARSLREEQPMSRTSAVGKLGRDAAKLGPSGRRENLRSSMRVSAARGSRRGKGHRGEARGRFG